MKVLNVIKNIIIAFLYLAMFLAVCVFFEGNGAFIYEAF